MIILRQFTSLAINFRKWSYFSFKLRLTLPKNILHGNVPKCSIAEYSTIKHLKTIKYDDSKEYKENLISKMNFKTYEDARPFYNLSVTSLLKIYSATKRDVSKGFCENRLYYLCNNLKCSPASLNNRLSKRTFVYTLSPEWLEKSLRVLLEMGVPPDRIIRDLWVLKYNHETIKNRLQKIKDAGIENLYPWMVRCSESILTRFLEISEDAKNILGEYKTTQMYLAKRLNISLEEVEEICVKVPSLKTVRVTKLKKFLDFLISEGFDVQEITDKPRVLSASQDTIKQRIELLRKIGVEYINLNILRRSKKDFEKYCEAMEYLNKKD